MLGLASYQEALRALGRLYEPATELRIAEQADRVCVEIGTRPGSLCRLGRGDLEEILLESHAHRGEQRAAGPLSDMLRSVGAALDELHAEGICLELSQETLRVRFSDNRELSYAGEELDALQRTATARRNGQPLSRVLILEASPDSVAHLREPLVAEFAVQALPTLLASAVAVAPEAPGLILAQASDQVLEAIQTLRSGARTAAVPIVVVASVDGHDDPGQLFAAGADDLLQEPLQPAQLRARVRTWLLRGRAGSGASYYPGR
jgi:CheY-like chemotaxis protein